MSRDDDKSKKIRLINSNLYEIHSNANRILKYENLNNNPSNSIQLSSYKPADLIGKRVARPDSISQSLFTSPDLEDLKDGLKTLNELQSRMRFLLKELEELV